MANTLGLDDDLDGVELVRNIEKAFDVEIGNEAEQGFTVGALYDLLRTKIPANQIDRKCASSMAFYRLRQGLGRIGHPGRLTPSSDVHFLGRGGIKSNFRRLEIESRLRLPRPSLTDTALVGCLAVALMLFVAPFLSFVSGWIVLAIVPVCAAIAWIDPGRLPKECDTLGGLARRTATLNYGLLIQAGASSSDKQLWNNLIELLSDYALPKSDIKRDTVFLQSQLKKKAAA
jgi:hypothetical protein